MIKIGIVGLGRMGLSHLSIVRPHPEVEVVGACDSSAYVSGLMAKYTGLERYPDHAALIESTSPHALIVATPSESHAEISAYALENGVDVFVEKPLALSLDDGKRVVELAARNEAVTQVGYHFRFVASFQEMHRLLERGVIGTVHNFRVTASGPAVLRPSGRTWRSKSSAGGGCLYDYASHAVNLATFLFGQPTEVGGAVLGRVFSAAVEDEVYATLYYPTSLTGQLSANWSDGSQRKMSMRVDAWGSNGRISADRQECRVYLHDGEGADSDLREGWTVRYTTDLTLPVRYYVRGEEYSHQLDYFVESVRTRRRVDPYDFSSAHDTDVVLDMIKRDAAGGGRTAAAANGAPEARPTRRGFGSFLPRRPAERT
jgi:predicted dehydrogenase